MRLRQRCMAMLFLAVLVLPVMLFFMACTINNGQDIRGKTPAVSGQGADTYGADTYGVIVIGGEPEGIAAAVSAARNGLSVLLLEDAAALGGLMTQGRLNFLDMSYGPNKELLTRGIFNEVYDRLGNAFDIGEAEEYFLELVAREENITLKLSTSFLSPIMQDNTIIGVNVKDTITGEAAGYYGKRIIDATVDADAAAAAGVPYTVGAEDYGLKDRLMGVTLVFEVEGVNWPYVFLYNNYQRLISKLKSTWGDANAGATRKVAWGYGKTALEYQAQDELTYFRGPNLARQKNGHVLINALLIFDVDSLDAESKAAGIARGQQEIPHILKFMQERFPGFAQVKLVDTAPELYVRESRHIYGEYRLTIDDVLENRDQWDRIAHGSYPVDIQASGPQELGNVVGKPAIYSIPFRSIVPLKVDNLLVVGRSASYDSLPHGSARVIPVGMAVGEAAGVAALYSLEHEMDFREMSKEKEAIAWVQARLIEQGAYLVAYMPPRPAVMEHWAYPGVVAMRRLGLAAGGYTNDYRLEAPIQYWDADYLLGRVLEAVHRFNPAAVFGEFHFPENLTRQDLLVGLAEAVGGAELTPQEARQLLQENGVLAGELAARYPAAENSAELSARPTFGELYMLLAGVEGIMK